MMRDDATKDVEVPCMVTKGRHKFNFYCDVAWVRAKEYEADSLSPQAHVRKHSHLKTVEIWTQYVRDYRRKFMFYSNPTGCTILFFLETFLAQNVSDVTSIHRQEHNCSVQP
jgi:hypothetical protein